MRDRRKAARKLLADGIYPSENRKAHRSARADRAANSFEVVAREWFAKYSTTWALSRLAPLVFVRPGGGALAGKACPHTFNRPPSRAA
jgi:hypothetical protein